MILIDFEGEILLDIAEIAIKQNRAAIQSGLAKRGWSEEHVEAGLSRAFSIETNGYPEGRTSPFLEIPKRPFWRRWFSRG